jgi:hypothetical protein
MGKKLLPSQVERVSIQNVTLEDVKKAKENGGRLKVMCEAESIDNLTKVCTMKNLIHFQIKFFNLLHHDSSSWHMKN